MFNGILLARRIGISLGIIAKVAKASSPWSIATSQTKYCWRRLKIGRLLCRTLNRLVLIIKKFQDFSHFPHVFKSQRGAGLACSLSPQERLLSSRFWFGIFKFTERHICLSGQHHHIISYLPLFWASWDSPSSSCGRSALLSYSGSASWLTALYSAGTRTTPTPKQSQKHSIWFWTSSRPLLRSGLSCRGAVVSLRFEPHSEISLFLIP